MTTPFTVVSLFSGAGGADTGLAQAGLKTIFAVDCWEIANDTFIKNHHIQPWTYPIKYVKSEHLPDSDVIVGGPPCQSFSIARYADNKMTGEGIANVLEMIRIVKEKQPKIFIFENVATLATSKFAMVESTIRKGFIEAGYKCGGHILNTCDYGIPQDRIRYFIFGVRNDLWSVGHRMFAPKTDHYSKHYSGWHEYLQVNMDIEEDNNWVYLTVGNRAIFRNPMQSVNTIVGIERPVLRYMPDWKDKQHSQGRRRVYKDTRMVTGIKQRELSPYEVASLQGFPRDYLFCGNKSEIRQQVGNAWSVPISKAIGEEIKRCFYHC